MPSHPIFDSILTSSTDENELAPYDIDPPICQGRTGAKLEISLSWADIEALMSRSTALKEVYDGLVTTCSAKQELQSQHQKIFLQALLTWVHIHSRTDNDWHEDIQEYIEYGCLSFGFHSRVFWLENPRFGGSKTIGNFEYCSCILDLLSKGNTIIPISFRAQRSDETYIVRRPDRYLKEGRMAAVKRVLWTAMTRPWFIEPSDDNSKKILALFDDFRDSLPLEVLSSMDDAAWLVEFDMIKAILISIGCFVAVRENRYTNKKHRDELRPQMVEDMLNRLTDQLTEKYSILKLHGQGSLPNPDELKNGLMSAIVEKKQRLLNTAPDKKSKRGFEKRWLRYLEVQREQLDVVKTFPSKDSPSINGLTESASDLDNNENIPKEENQPNSVKQLVEEHLEGFKGEFLDPIRGYKVALEMLVSYVENRLRTFQEIELRMRPGCRSRLAVRLHWLHDDCLTERAGREYEAFCCALFSVFEDSDMVINKKTRQTRIYSMMRRVRNPKKISNLFD